MIKHREYYINRTKYCSGYSSLFDDILPSINTYGGDYKCNENVIRFDFKLTIQEMFDLLYGDNINHLLKDLYIK